MRNRLSIVFYLLIALTTTSVISAYALRNLLLETLIRIQLIKHNLPLQSVSGLDISFDELRVRDLVAGKYKEFHIHEAHVVWNLRNFFTTDPISVVINELTMDMEIPTEQALFTQVSSGKSAFDMREFSLPWLPIVALKGSTVNYRSAQGNGTMTLSGEIAAAESGGRVLDLNVIFSGNLIQSSIMLAAALDSRGNMQGKIAFMNGSLHIPQMSITHFKGNTTFKFAAMQLQNMQTEFEFSDILLNPRVSMDSKAEMVIGQVLVSGDVVGLPDFLTGNFDVHIKNGQWLFESMQLQQLEASLPLQIDVGKKNYHIGLRNPSTVMIGKVKSIHPVRMRKKIEFSITQADFELTKHDDDWSLQHSVAVASNNLALVVERADVGVMDVQIHPGPMTLTGKIDKKKQYQGQITIGDTALMLSQLQLKTSGISVIANWNDANLGNDVDFSIEQIRILLPQSLLAPISISGSIRSIAPESSEHVLNLNGGIPGLHFIHVKANHAMGNGKGKLSAELGPLTFSSMALQPGALFPWLDQWKNVSGQIYGNAQLYWSASGISSSSGSLDIHDFSFENGSIILNDLNLSLQLENLPAPRSPPHQAITIRRIDLGAPIENLLVYYQLKHFDPFHLNIEKAQFSFMDGMVSIAPDSIIAEDGADLLVHVSNFDLKTLFDLMQIDGLSGNGHLDGQIPITLSENQIVIKDGYLTAKTPGVLHFKSEKAAQYLVSGGEEMNLLLRTLQNFYYTELTLTLDKSADHNLLIKLSLLGNNPQVKGGQNFRLNFKLETEFDKLLLAIKESYGITQEILGGSFRFH